MAIAATASLAGAILLVAQAWAVSRVIAGAFLSGADLARLWVPIALLPPLIAGRALLGWLAESTGQAAASRVKSILRERVTEHLLELGPRALGERRTGGLSAALTQGTDALDAYFAGYLPQLLLAIATPLLVIGWVLPRDPLAAAILVGTAPLIPVFMGLVGLAARGSSERRWRTLALLGGHLLDVLEGLPTLRVFGRAAAQAATIEAVSERHRQATMATLRIGFLSALVLEMFATISTALVAVAIGLRLEAGGLGLEDGLAVLILTPEVYLPLRRLGTHFHASQEALAAADRIFEILAVPPLARSGHRQPSPGPAEVRLEEVGVTFAGRGEVLRALDLTLRPGEILALAGPSGSGKSTIAALLLGFLPPSQGRILVGGIDLAEIDPKAWRAQVTWVPQAPHLFAGSIADNIRLGNPVADRASVTRAAAAAGLGPVLAGLPAGLDSQVGERGQMLSAGQRQRVALARALIRPARLAVLDEPTAHLDQEAERQVIEELRRLPGHPAILLIVHSRDLAEGADRWQRLEAPEARTAAAAGRP